MTISWEEMLQKRTLIPSTINSLHMMECIRIVSEKYPRAEIHQTGENSWRLLSEKVFMSNPHNSHYACWAEAREIIDASKQD